MRQMLEKLRLWLLELLDGKPKNKFDKMNEEEIYKYTMKTLEYSRQGKVPDKDKEE